MSTVAGVVPDRWIEKLFEVCNNNSFENMESYVNDITCEGFAGSQLINQLHDRIVTSDDYSDLQKSVRRGMGIATPPALTACRATLVLDGRKGGQELGEDFPISPTQTQIFQIYFYVCHFLRVQKPL